MPTSPRSTFNDLFFGALNEKRTVLYRDLIQAVNARDVPAIRSLHAASAQDLRILLANPTNHYQWATSAAIGREELRLFDTIMNGPPVLIHKRAAHDGSPPHDGGQVDPLLRTQQLSDLKRWRELQEALEQAGHAPSQTLKLSCRQRLIDDIVDIPSVHWMLDRQVLDQDWMRKLRANRDSDLVAMGDALCLILRRQGPEEMALFERLKTLALVGGEDSLIGVSDLAMHMLFKCAQVLIDAGDTPKACKWSQGSPRNSNLGPISPIEGYLRMTLLRSSWPAGWESAFSPAVPDATRKSEPQASAEEKTTQVVINGLRQLVQWGAR